MRQFIFAAVAVVGTCWVLQAQAERSYIEPWSVEKIQNSNKFPEETKKCLIQQLERTEEDAPKNDNLRVARQWANCFTGEAISKMTGVECSNAIREFDDSTGDVLLSRLTGWLKKWNAYLPEPIIRLCHNKLLESKDSFDHTSCVRLPESIGRLQSEYTWDEENWWGTKYKCFERAIEDLPFTGEGVFKCFELAMAITSTGGSENPFAHRYLKHAVSCECIGDSDAEKCQQQKEETE